MIIISNTETRSFQNCERKHYWSFGEGIVSKNGATKALDRGIIGHSALETYYKSKKAGRSKRVCTSYMLEVLDAAEEEQPKYEKEIGQLRYILPKYVENYWGENWEILEVETQYDTHMFDINDEPIHYGMRLDLLVKEGKKIILVDHKFLWDFFSTNEIDINTQMMKYLKTLKLSGINVSHAILNQIRYRQLKEFLPENHFRRTPVNPPKKVLDNVWEEQKKEAHNIASLRLMPKSEHKAATRMSLDYKGCGSCSYMRLCRLDLEGYNASNSLTMRENYKPNSYGYQETDKSV